MRAPIATEQKGSVIEQTAAAFEERAALAAGLATPMRLGVLLTSPVTFGGLCVLFLRLVACFCFFVSACCFLAILKFS